MNKLTLAALFGASALALTACGSHSSTTNTTTTTTTSSTNTVAPPPAGGNGGGGGDTAAGGSESGSGDQAAGGSGGSRQDFTIVNHTGHTLVTLNVSPSDSNQWGPDILGRDTLANGESASITFPRETSQCNWDIRATYDDNDTTDNRNVNLCQTTSVEMVSQ